MERSQPEDPGPGPGDLYDVPRLAARLGVQPTALRKARARSRPWLPEPAGWLNGGLVWTASSLDGIEQNRPRAGRPRTAPVDVDEHLHDSSEPA